MSKGPPCGGCYYFTFDGLRRTCVEPTEPRHLDNGGPQQCKPFVASDAKQTDGVSFAKRLTLEQFRQRMMQSNTGQGKEQ